MNNRFKPLFYEKDALIFSRRNKIFKLNNDESIEYLFSLPSNFFILVISYFRIISRLLRLDVYNAILYKNKYYICFLRKLYVYDTKTKILKVEMNFKNSNGPLSFMIGKNLKGFENTLYFGDYISDSNFNETSIYKKNLQNNEWTKCYVFPEGKINHIHSIVPDIENDCAWILTGDYGESYGIYMAKDNFTDVKPIITGHQDYRSCVAFATKKGLLYATDSHLELNSIRLLQKNDDKWISEYLFPLNGPVIYGCELLDYYIFATSVEPGLEKKSFIGSLFDLKKGPGIIHNRVEIVGIRKRDMKLIQVYKNPKDFYPSRLFQFGSAMFPLNANKQNMLPAYFNATKFYEGRTKFFDLLDCDNTDNLNT